MQFLVMHYYVNSMYMCIHTYTYYSTLYFATSCGRPPLLRDQFLLDYKVVSQKRDYRYSEWLAMVDYFQIITDERKIAAVYLVAPNFDLSKANTSNKTEKMDSNIEQVRYSLQGSASFIEQGGKLADLLLDILFKANVWVLET